MGVTVSGLYREQTSPDHHLIKTPTNQPPSEPWIEKLPLSEEVVFLVLGHTATCKIVPSTQHTHRLFELINRGDILWKNPSKSVVKISSSIVVKSMNHPGDDSLTQEQLLTRFVMESAPKVPLARPMGVLYIAGVMYGFMSYVSGQTVEACWTGLSSTQKQDIVDQLGDILGQLRTIKRPSGSSLGSLTNPAVCKDTRMQTRCSIGSLESESEFNKFLLATPKPRATLTYLMWLRNMLRDDHRIMMTHGDLQPGNIIVLQDSISGAIKISGIIDWEMGGWYPEYWDIVKALNTHGSDDESDWWLTLASMPLFTAYRAEIAIDHLVEASMARP